MNKLLKIFFSNTRLFLSDVYDLRRYTSEKMASSRKKEEEDYLYDESSDR